MAARARGAVTAPRTAARGRTAARARGGSRCPRRSARPRAAPSPSNGPGTERGDSSPAERAPARSNAMLETPALGYGIGLRPPHYEDVLRGAFEGGEPDWFE